MRLLITTQAVDQNDPILGFFCRWIEEFAKLCESVEVICLRQGEHHLPSNVRVHALGSATKLGRSLELLRLARALNYDAVFVHMNPEYLVALGWLWRLMGKRAVLWYMHKSVNLKLRVAVWFANAVVTGSKESFRLKTSKLHILSHGIDTDFFAPDPAVARGAHWLSVGRLTASKRHDIAIRKAAAAGKDLRIAGSGPEQAALESLARELGARVTFLGGLTQEQLREEYRRAARLIHTSETGSLDKVVLEALACGLPIETTDPALRHMESEGPAYVRERHSLSELIPRILAVVG